MRAERILAIIGVAAIAIILAGLVSPLMLLLLLLVFVLIIF